METPTNSPPNTADIEYHIAGGEHLDPALYKEARSLTWSRIEDEDGEEFHPDQLPDQQMVHGTVWAIAKSEGKVVGAGFVRPPLAEDTFSNSMIDESVELDEVAVHEEHDRKGIGSEMLKLLEKEIKELGHEALHAYPVTVESYDFLTNNGFTHADPELKKTREDLPMLHKRVGANS